MEIAVLSTQLGESETADRAQVDLQLWSPFITAQICISPEEALDLAARLTEAAHAAATPIMRVAA
jgi:hypothetical protein